jgi:hypothetical protein
VLVDVVVVVVVFVPGVAEDIEEDSGLEVAGEAVDVEEEEVVLAAFLSIV